MEAMTATGYLHRELKFNLREFQALPKKDQKDLRQWALDEMKQQGIPVKEVQK